MNNRDDSEKIVLGYDEMFCHSCGNVVKRTAEYCLSCGIKPRRSTGICYESSDEAKGWEKAISFFVPVAGTVFYAIWKNQRPVAAKGILGWLIAGWVLTVIFSIIYVFVSVIASWVS